ncbi:MAG: CRISPR-associated endonuclease Cas1 [Anaerolineae bacterium]
MTTVYVNEQGAVVRKRGERLVVTKEDRELDQIRLVNLDQVVVVGNVQLTTPAVAKLMESNIDVIFLTRYYKYVARIVAYGSKNAGRRLAQLKMMSDESQMLPVAKAVVIGKLTNQRVLMQRQASVRGGGAAGAAMRQAIDGIAAMRDGAAKAESLDSLRGYEGKGAAYYFAAVKALLDPRWGFQGRAYYPPPDPINAALSLGYALLLKDTMTAVQIVGLDPFLGFFHVIEEGRPSLPLDVMEEFRPVVVDSVVLAMVHEGRLTPADFVQTGDPKRPVQMSEAGMERLIEGYERRLQDETRHPVTGDKTTYRRCIEGQVWQMAGIVEGRAKTYAPIMLR